MTAALQNHEEPGSSILSLPFLFSKPADKKHNEIALFRYLTKYQVRIAESLSLN